MVGWTPDLDAMVLLDDEQRDRALGLLPFARGEARRDSVVVPWQCTYVLPELAIQPTRCLALNALARFSGNRTAVIGFDCVPLTSPETTAEGFPAVFALNLAAVSQMDTVVAISEAAANEYRGWRRMLAGAGLAGPDIAALSLPVQAPQATAESLEAARRLLLVADLPMVLVVGSHEPRKNHLAVLHAAELLWRTGLRFTLTFVGGSSWGGVEFMERLEELAAAGRPVEALSKLDDETLWAAYRLARVSVFPSLNEGFGLPVGESIAAGTPAITSNFGSMREIAEGGGALMVDPRRTTPWPPRCGPCSPTTAPTPRWPPSAGPGRRRAGRTTPTCCGGSPTATIPVLRPVPGRFPKAPTISRNRRADAGRKVWSDVTNTESQVRAEHLATLPLQATGPGGSFGDSMVGQFRDIWAHRELLDLLVRRELKARYKDSTLGFLWSLAAAAGAAAHLLHRDRPVPRRRPQHPGLRDLRLHRPDRLGPVLGDRVSAGTASIVTNAGLIKKIYLPREIFPLARVGSALFNFAIQLVILVAATSSSATSPPAIRWLYLPLSLAVIVVSALGLVAAARPRSTSTCATCSTSSRSR